LTKNEELIVAYHLFARGGQRGSPLSYLPLCKSTYYEFFQNETGWDFHLRTSYHLRLRRSLSNRCFTQRQYSMAA